MKGSVSWTAIVKRGLQVFLFLFVQAAIFFAAAGTLNFPRGWLYYGLAFAHVVVNMVVFLTYAPEIIEARSKIKPGTKTWDILFALGYTAMLLAIPAVSGSDLRFGLSNLGIGFATFGVVLYVVGAAIVSWAMLANKYFENTVLVQKGQYTVTTGPYAFVRHPGYVGVVLINLAMPLVVGSVYGLIPVTMLIILFIFRTSLEDKTLYQELEGYREYAKKVRYRLIPGVW